MENVGGLPVIDISPFKSCDGGDPDAKELCAKAVQEAASRVGFFYVKGHGIPEKLMKDVFCSTSDFFSLPKEEKEKVVATKSPLWRGYISTEAALHLCKRVPGQTPDQKESFTIGAEPCQDGSRSSPMHGENQWPSGVVGFRSTMTEYWDSLIELSRAIARALAVSLSLPETFFTEYLQDPAAQFLLLKYPPPDGEGDHPGCGAHTDCGFLTILAQNDVSGLEVKHRDGEWIPAPAVEGAFIVNLGDMAQRWTNDRFVSTWHRVNNKSTKVRYSIPFFCNCDFDAPVSCITSEGEENCKYEDTTAGEYILRRLGLMRLMRPSDGEEDTKWNVSASKIEKEAASSITDSDSTSSTASTSP